MNALTHARWRRSPALQPLSQLNESLIEMLVDFARRPEPPPPAYAIVTPLRQRFRHCDASARRRLAELPFLLVDLRLTDETVWAQALHHGRTASDRPRRRSADDARSVMLARGVTLLAWHVVHSNAGGAAVHFGMSPGVAELLRQASVLELDGAATLLAPLSRPRWGDRPSAWLYLLTRASSDRAPMRDETVYGLQLLGSDLLPAVPTIQKRRPTRGLDT